MEFSFSGILDRASAGQQNYCRYTSKKNQDYKTGGGFLKKLFSFLAIFLMIGIFSVSAQEALPFSETFDGTTIPATWTVEDTGGDPVWGISETAIAGGAVNELLATWVSFDGTTRCYTPTIDVDGVTNIALSFKHFYDDYAEGATLKVQYSTTGLTWVDTGWEIVSGSGNVGPATANILVPNPAKATTMQFSWTIEGNHYQYDGWVIDDVLVDVAPAYSVSIANMTGDSLVQIGESFFYQLRVTNAGDTDDDYTFTLSKGWADGLYADTAENPVPDPLSITAGNYADVYLKVTVPVGTPALTEMIDTVQANGTGVSDSVAVTSTAMDMWLNEDFADGYDGWNIYQMGDATAVSWEWNSGGYMVHGWTAAGEVADNWLVSPQVTIEPTRQEELIILQFYYAWTEPDYYVYHGLWVSLGSGDPADGDFFELTELAPDPEEDPGYFYGYAYDISALAGHTFYLAFVYQGEDADLMAVTDILVYDDAYVWPDTYALTLTSDPAEIGATLTGAGDYAQGATVNISADTPAGYNWLGWGGFAYDLALLADPFAQSTSFTMPYRAIDLYAVYEPIYAVTLLANPSDIGVVLTGAGDYAEAEAVNISASLPPKGYVFVEWQGLSEDVALLADPYAESTSFTMPARAVEFTAYYEEEGGDYTPACISLENASIMGIWLWEYSPTKSPYMESKGSSWTKILAGVVGTKILAGDISNDGNLEIVALLPGMGLYYYDILGATWTSIIGDAAGVTEFTLAKTTAQGPVQVVASFSSNGIQRWTFGGSWTAVNAMSADILAAGNINRDVDGIDELVVVFTGYAGYFLYDFTTASFTNIINISPSQVAVADVTADGYLELVTVFDGFGIYIVRYIPEKGLDMKQAGELSPEFDIISDIPENHVWVSKGSLPKGFQFNRITYASPASGHYVGVGDISGTAGAEILFTYADGRTYYYSYDLKGWSTLIMASLKRIISGNFTGGTRDDLIVCETSTGSVYLRITDTGSWENIAAGGDTNAMTAIE